LVPLIFYMVVLVVSWKGTQDCWRMHFGGHCMNKLWIFKVLGWGVHNNNPRLLWIEVVYWRQKNVGFNTRNMYQLGVLALEVTWWLVICIQILSLALKSTWKFLCCLNIQQATIWVATSTPLLLCNKSQNKLPYI